MFLLPYNKTTYVTALDSDEVVMRLVNNVDDEDYNNDYNKSFTGRISGYEFYMYGKRGLFRNGVNHMAFLKGKIKRVGNDLHIETQLRIQLFPAAIFLIFVGMLCYSIIRKAMEPDSFQSEGSIWGFYVFAFSIIYLFFLIPYKINYYRNHRFIKALLEATELKN